MPRRQALLIAAAAFLSGCLVGAAGFYLSGQEPIVVDQLQKERRVLLRMNTELSAKLGEIHMLNGAKRARKPTPIAPE
jgi:hypothetical protein